MANATVTLTTLHRDITRRKRKLIISAAIGAGNYVVGGLTIDFATTLNPKLLPLGKPASNPAFGEVTNAPAGYGAELIAGSTIHNWLLKIYTAPGTELTAIAIPAALVADPYLLEVQGAIGAF